MVRKGDIPDSDLVNVLSVLGLDGEGQTTKAASKDQFVKRIRTLCDYHSGNFDENEYADILGELLFNSNVFF